MSQTRRSRRKIIVRAFCICIVGFVGYYAITAFPAIRDLYRAGIFDTLGERKYTGTTIDDLKAIRTALMLYHESEGQFPASDHWMEAIQQRIRTDDMSGKEAAKKLIDPVFSGQPGKYGFAMNDATSGKYKGDIKDPKTPLVFESQDPSRNAHGDPIKLAPVPAHAGGNLAIAVDGTILHLGN